MNKAAFIAWGGVDYPQKSTMKVYFIACKCPELVVKIGITAKIEWRLRDLQFMCPVELTLIGVCNGGSDLEKALHEEFKSDRRKGEWFTGSDALCRRIQELCPDWTEKQAAFFPPSREEAA